MEVALSQLWHYGSAVLLVAIASLLILLAPDSTIAENPWLIGFAPVILSARYGGLGPGLLATVLAGLACAYGSLSSNGAIAVIPNDLIELGIFGLEGILICALMEFHPTPPQPQPGQLSEKQLRAILDNAPVGLYVVGGSHWEFVNQYLCSWLGLTSEQILGSGWIDSIHPDDREWVVRATTASLTGGHAFEAEYRILDQSGTSYWILDRAVPVRDQAGQLLFIQGSCVDITARKQAEECLQTLANQLQERTTELSIARAHTQAILDYTPASIYIIDTDGYMRFANTEWYRIFGDVLGNPIEGRNLRDFLPPEAAAVFFRENEEIFSSAKVMTFENDMTLPDGVHSFLRIKFPLQDTNGEVYAFCGVSLDITERKQAEEKLQALTRQLQAQNEQLAEVSRLKSEFLTNMSHELRTPLTSILGFSSVLLQKNFGALNPKQEQYLSLIHSSGEHLLALINDLLDLAKIEAGRLELYREELNLAAVCQAALEMVQVRALSKQQQLSQELPVACEFILGDRQRILQILLNYLSNAIKFTPAGGTITLKTQLATAVELQSLNVLESGGDAVLSDVSSSMFVGLSVTDTGMGVSLEDQHLLFQTFQQVDGTTDRQHEGTGLGLALTKRLVELHGGRVSFISTCGVGSTFSAWFPLPETSVEPV
uniref:sensor histidine kinase n=1 Tax=Trichocoleus desertorum TaxID=1481672 RepID=UPI0025B2A0D2|nr:PAS domain S-box protein [Trichocoleus desertorum]